MNSFLLSSPQKGQNFALSGNSELHILHLFSASFTFTSTLMFTSFKFEILFLIAVFNSKYIFLKIPNSCSNSLIRFSKIDIFSCFFWRVLRVVLDIPLPNFSCNLSWMILYGFPCLSSRSAKIIFSRLDFPNDNPSPLLISI